MSRNLGSTCCHVCHGAVVLEEEPRPIRPDECSGFEDRYVGKLTVAHSHCSACGALYLAWVMMRGSSGHLRNADRRPFVDLSFRHAFNAEPNSKDPPPVAKLREIADVARRQSIATMRGQIADLESTITEIESAMGGPSFWEAYLR